MAISVESRTMVSGPSFALTKSRVCMPDTLKPSGTTDISNPLWLSFEHPAVTSTTTMVVSILTVFIIRNIAKSFMFKGPRIAIGRCYSQRTPGARWFVGTCTLSGAEIFRSGLNRKLEINDFCELVYPIDVQAICSKFNENINICLYDGLLA